MQISHYVYVWYTRIRLLRVGEIQRKALLWPVADFRYLRFMINGLPVTTLKGSSIFSAPVTSSFPDAQIKYIPTRPSGWFKQFLFNGSSAKYQL